MTGMVRNIKGARRFTWLVLMVAIFAAGCARSPELRKQDYLEKGDSYFQKGRYREAAIMYQNAIQIDPRFAQAHLQLAETYLKESQWQTAYLEAQRAADLDPKNWKAQLIVGDLLLAGGQSASARDTAETVLKGDPKSAEAQILLSRADAEQGDLAKAVAEVQKGIQMDPSRSASYLILAAIQDKLGDAAAEQSFQKAVSLDSKSVAALVALGDYFARRKRWLEAQKEFEAAVIVEPQNALPRRSLANLYLAEGQTDKAEQVMRDAGKALKDDPEGYRLLGEYYVRTGQMDKALAEFASVHAAHPKDQQAADVYAQLLISKNRLDEASKIIDNTLKASPLDRGGLVLRAQLLIRQGRISDAVHVLQGAVKDAPDDAAAHYYLGIAYAADANLGQAETEWTEAARLQPRMIEPHRALANVGLRKGDMTLVADNATQLMNLEPRAPEGYIFHAAALVRQGNAAGAEADLKKAMEVAPDNALAYTRMAELRLGQKRYDDAEKFGVEALKRDPASFEALGVLVDTDFARKQPLKALQRVSDQIALAPSNSNFYVLLGQVELRNQNPAKAKEAYEKATQIDKNNVTAFLLLASLQASLGQADQAIAEYQTALQNNPRDVRIYMFLASLLQTRGEWQRAEEFDQKALQVEPNYAPAANDLAYLMLEHGGNIDVALSLAQNARRGLPDIPNTADTLGWAYYSHGVYAAAIDLLQEAVKANSKSPTYHYHLGMAYWKAKNYAMAKTQLQETLEISPNYNQAGDIKKILNETPQKN